MKWSNLASDRRAYLLINLSFGILIASVFVYSAVFPPEPGGHPVPCAYTELTGESCNSCGLSRGFSYIIRGQTTLALETNQHSLRVFLFFILQFFLRIFGSTLLQNPGMPLKPVLLTDGILSTASLMAAFLPMLF